MKKYLLLSLLIVAFSINSVALNTEQRMANRHSFTIGYGEQFYDLFGTNKLKSVGDGFSRKEYYNKKITGNIFMEYMYQATKVLSVGLNVNYNG
ncbi:MAG: hypothetical protein ACI3ZZ_02155 [Candidatus Aphodosoma sp.]